MEISITRNIPTTPEKIYTHWLSSDGHTNMTGGVATGSAKVGDNFTAWDGYITGKNLILEPFERIVQSWRTSQFKEGEVDSQIEVLLEKVKGGTSLTLHHTKVPESGEHYRKGWDEHYFEPMISYFSSLK